ncbi:acetolactate synthase small subunit [Diplocloster modestus]|uniref:Acetolactate synthase small subunit n=1 Tax=Diplocloster modestus TaxID=2850322 RepID=A0ABS6KCC6_9FIRM|nr:acetolactate synthase small subunit [Diplocloster modestus]MBU9728153.1 acetolactate synthase small subunit [Diplocloster modestus]
MDQTVLSMLVDNTSGVLSRVAGLFSRRGYNIESLTVGVTADPRFSRMTVVVRGDEVIIEQIENQLRKLVDVVDIKKLLDKESVSRELILLKVRAQADDRQAIIAVANIFRANIVDVAPDSLIIELTGNQSKLDAFIGLLSGYEILELARTGITGLSRGSKDVRYFD